jgi:hypothetical protein
MNCKKFIYTFVKSNYITTATIDLKKIIHNFFVLKFSNMETDKYNELLMLITNDIQFFFNNYIKVDMYKEAMINFKDIIKSILKMKFVYKYLNIDMLNSEIIKYYKLEEI